MRRPCFRALAPASVLLLLVPAPARAGRPVETAPAVELQDQAGRVVRIADLRGRVVLVDFWASWCGPCAASFPMLDDLYRRRHGEGLEVLAVNVDEERAAADRFLAGRSHQMPVFFDPKGVSPEAFHVEGMPSSYLLDRQGRIRFRHVGYRSSVGPVLEREVGELLSEEVPVAKP